MRSAAAAGQPWLCWAQNCVGAATQPLKWGLGETIPLLVGFCNFDIDTFGKLLQQLSFGPQYGSACYHDWQRVLTDLNALKLIYKENVIIVEEKPYWLSECIDVNIEELYSLLVAITPPPGQKEMLNLIKSRPQVEKLSPALF